jgi:type IV fimbrial biogenesis protein FimT
MTIYLQGIVMTARTRQKAYSLIELITTISVIAITLGIALPVFSSILTQSRQEESVHQLHAYINYARAAAINTRTLVSMCAGTQTCSPANQWSGNIFVFHDRNRNGLLDANEELLRTNAINTKHRWSWSNFRQKKYLAFKPDGTTDSLNGTFTLCESSNALRSITINMTGRAKLAETADASKCKN